MLGEPEPGELPRLGLAEGEPIGGVRLERSRSSIVIESRRYKEMDLG